jgi:guanosine-3',5'-bis(diphosphate) 3'-pyrophosphohydrolase
MSGTTTDSNPVSAIFASLSFAAERHRDHRRKGSDESPYVNHLIAVAEILLTTGAVSDSDVIKAGILHDTLEDTETTAEELEKHFGARVRTIVEEVTDDKTLLKEERKRLQIEHAPHISREAKLVKLADKISNVTDIGLFPPAGWPDDRRLDYIVWAENVVAGLRGANAALERRFDETVIEARRRLGV